MSNINYTFPADCKVPQLRGVTATGGVFCVASGKWRQPIDAVKFTTEIDGKGIIAMISGKPELEAALTAHLARIADEKAALDSTLAAIGWPQYQAVQSRACNAREAYDRASEYGYPAKEAGAMQAADVALDAARAQYPGAAAYVRAESYSMASHDQKASAGRRAMDAIESGADPIATIAVMEAEWSAAAEKAVQNA